MIMPDSRLLQAQGFTDVKRLSEQMDATSNQNTTVDLPIPHITEDNLECMNANYYLNYPRILERIQFRYVGWQCCYVTCCIPASILFVLAVKICPLVQ